MLATLLAGCIAPEDDVFVCEEDRQCASPGFAWCEANGYCSFLDPDCESNRRYGSLAPDGIAYECVPPQP